MAKKNGPSNSQEMSLAEMRQTMVFLLRQEQAHDARLRRIENRLDQIAKAFKRAEAKLDKLKRSRPSIQVKSVIRVQSRAKQAEITERLKAIAEGRAKLAAIRTQARNIITSLESH